MTSSERNEVHPFFSKNAQLPQDVVETPASDEDQSLPIQSLDDSVEHAPAKRKRKTKTTESAASQAALFTFLGKQKPIERSAEPVTLPPKEKKSRKPRKKVKIDGELEDDDFIERGDTEVNHDSVETEARSGRYAAQGVAPALVQATRLGKEEFEGKQLPVAEGLAIGVEDVQLSSSIVSQAALLSTGLEIESASKPAIVVANQKDSVVKDVLKLNGHGGFRSLSKPEQMDATVEPTVQDKPRRTRKRKGLVVMRYAKKILSERMQIGKRITYILSQPPAPMATTIVENTGTEQPVKTKRSPRKIRAKANAATHPFFTGEKGTSRQGTPPPTTQTQTQPSPRTFRSFTTPGKLRSQAQLSHTEELGKTQPARIPPQSRLFSLPGTFHPAWPAHGLVHCQPSDSAHPKVRQPFISTTTARRKKKNTINLPQHNLLDNITNCSTHRVYSSMTPRRAVMTCPSVKGEVDTRIATRSCHPALARLRDQIATNLTPFDCGAFEIQAWAQKYAPQTSAEVLQTGKEGVVLRDWLEGQTTALSQGRTRSKEEEKARKKRKRKRKEEGLEGFIVDSDDDVELQSLEDGEGEGELRSLVRGTDASNPAANAVLLCGPHGCGKTASVYAAAKELGFDVFEIGSNSRRSGRDILEKVGDMSLNHQVRRKERSSTVGSVDGDQSDLDLTLPAEPDDQQRSLTSFFGTATTKEKKPVQVIKPGKRHEAQLQQLSKLREQISKQKQSLILIEEADILFEEDKSFWETIITLATQSRRPIVITCNDENLIPTDGLSLHAILHLRPPPPSLVIDYLLLIAALEGHLLHRDAVQSLYRLRHQDLRGTIIDLQFWCQMAVADDRGGVDWYLQRWPKGIDQDENGHTFRVMSCDTYTPDLHNQSEGQAISDSVIQSWRECGKEPVASAHAALSNGSLRLSENPRAALSQTSYIYDALSALDIYAYHDLPRSANCENDDSLDPTQPKASRKTSLDYISGYRFLDNATPAVDYEQLDTQLHAFVCSTIVPPAIGTSSETKTDTLTALPQSSLAFTRAKVDTALEPLFAAPSAGSASSFGGSTPSATSLVTPASRDFLATILDTAPYVRSIISYDLALEAQRNALSAPPASQNSADGASGGEGSAGPTAKKARTTRASRSALEGNKRELTRRERWFAGLKKREAMLRVVGTGFSGV